MFTYYHHLISVPACAALVLTNNCGFLTSFSHSVIFIGSDRSNNIFCNFLSLLITIMAIRNRVRMHGPISCRTMPRKHRFKQKNRVGLKSQEWDRSGPRLSSRTEDGFIYAYLFNLDERRGSLEVTQLRTCLSF